MSEPTHVKVIHQQICVRALKNAIDAYNGAVKHDYPDDQMYWLESIIMWSHILMGNYDDVRPYDVQQAIGRTPREQDS